MARNSTSPSSAMVRHLIDLLGDDVVLLPCGKGEKGSRWEKWQEHTIEKMREQPYLSALGRAHNIAVLLGKASGGLCTIDIDDDDSIEPFLALNPKLRETLRSRGKRGCNLWVRIKGDFPGTSPLKRPDGSAWGEWRSNRSCTMIHGIHPDGMRYERSPEVLPIPIAFDEIVWPAELTLPWKGGPARKETKPAGENTRKLTADEVRDMLYHIPARPGYDEWLKISSAVWSVLGEEDGTAMLRAWSPEEKAGEYDEKFKHRLERVTAGTLVHIAKQHGWRGKTPVRSDMAPAMTTTEAIEKFYYDGNGKYHLDTGVLLVPMDQRSVIRHLKLWGFSDTPASDGVRAFFGFRPTATGGDLPEAARAALDLADFLREEATLQTQAGHPALSWGLGVSVGPLLTGIHGPDSARFWTASGPAVEQARQLAALNARHLTTILVGRRAADVLASDFTLQPVEGDAIHSLLAAKSAAPTHAQG